MAFEDKTLQCADCGNSFTFSADEQELFESRGFTNEPRRCLSCRQARRSDRRGEGGGGGFGAPRQMFPVVCAECGKDTEVPFEPRGDRPVYCNDCYRQMRPAR